MSSPSAHEDFPSSSDVDDIIMNNDGQHNENDDEAIMTTTNDNPSSSNDVETCMNDDDERINIAVGELHHDNHHHQNSHILHEATIDNQQVQETQKQYKFYAIRRGKYGLRSSVFFNWDDCERFVHGYELAEYASFDTFEEVQAYLSDNIVGSASAVQGVAAAAAVEQGEDGCKNDFSLISPFTIKSIRRGKGVRVKAQANPNRKPTKAWDRMYQRYFEYVAKKGTSEVDNSKENIELLRWTRQQQHEYRYMKEGKASSMFQMKIDKLRSIGFEFKYASTEEILTSLLNFKAKHGHYNVPENHPTLGKWVKEQKKTAKKFVNDGDATGFFDAKVKELMSLGFQVVSVGETQNETKTDIQRKSTNRLETSGFSINQNIISIPETEGDEEKWTKNFKMLQEYKDEHGDCEVPPSLQTPLAHWVTQQHKEYQKVQDGKPSRLTLERVQQLTDIGFVFRRVAKSFTWEERMDQLRHYREKNGHLKVPKSDPLLGGFVNRQRYEYSKFKANRPSSMNESRIKDLQSLNFIFVAGKKMDHVDYKNKKTWDERFQELLQFRDTYGHTVVPQTYPGLGEWVHSQRLYYKRLKDGKKSPLTNERLVKLAEASFVFNATKRRGSHMNNANEPNSMHSTTSLVPITAIQAAAEAPNNHSTNQTDTLNYTINI